MAKGVKFVHRLATGLQTRAYSAPSERAIPAAKRKYVPTTGSYPLGFLAGSSFAGVKDSNKQYDDVALVVSEKPCPAAAVFTRNIFQAAPVTLSKEILQDKGHSGKYQGVVANSGCANAVTGTLGHEDARIMASTVDKCFNNTSTLPRTLVMSTGVIGKRLPIAKIEDAIPKAHKSLGSTHENWMAAARAICTTDTFPKLLSRTFTLPSHPETTYSIAGMTKGAGMMHPNMGTLLGIICTDANIEQESLHGFLSEAVNSSFNCVSVDGDTSTNDTVALFANGAAAPADSKPVRNEANPSSDAREFAKVLRQFTQELAQLLVRDGEGATKFVTVRVQSRTSLETARAVAESISTSPLVKTALYGRDANWGRILCAIGYTPSIMHKPQIPVTSSTSSSGSDPVTPATTSVSFLPADGSEALNLLVRGEPQEVDEVRAKEILEMEDLEILVQLDDDGKAERKVHEITYWTCDFSHEYVTINGDYRT